MLKKIKEKILQRAEAFGNLNNKMSRRIVRYSIGFISLYTAAAMFINVRWGIEPNVTLTTCVYGFFGTELVMLMVKRIKVGSKGETVYEKEETN